MILHHPLRPDGGQCGHYWQATTADGARCPACGGTTGIEVTDRDTLPVGEPVWRRPTHPGGTE